MAWTWTWTWAHGHGTWTWTWTWTHACACAAYKYAGACVGAGLLDLFLDPIPCLLLAQDGKTPPAWSSVWIAD